MAISEGITWVTQAFAGTTLFGWTGWLNLLFAIITLVIITRKTSHWKTLALPVVVMWHISGVRMNVLVAIVCAIPFLLEALEIGGTITEPIRSRISETIRKPLKIKSRNERALSLIEQKSKIYNDAHKQKLTDAQKVFQDNMRVLRENKKRDSLEFEIRRRELKEKSDRQLKKAHSYEIWKPRSPVYKIINEAGQAAKGIKLSKKGKERLKNL